MNPSERGIVVTGASSSLWRQVLASMANRGWEKVVGLDRTDYDLLVPAEVERMYAEHRPDLLCHLADSSGETEATLNTSPSLFYETMMMSLNLLEQARCCDTKKVVLVAPPSGDAESVLPLLSRTYRERHGLEATCLFPTGIDSAEAICLACEGDGGASGNRALPRVMTPPGCMERKRDILVEECNALRRELAKRSRRLYTRTTTRTPSLGPSSEASRLRAQAMLYVEKEKRAQSSLLRWLRSLLGQSSGPMSTSRIAPSCSSAEVDWTLEAYSSLAKPRVVQLGSRGLHVEAIGLVPGAGIVREWLGASESDWETMVEAIRTRRASAEYLWPIEPQEVLLREDQTAEDIPQTLASSVVLLHLRSDDDLEAVQRCIDWRVPVIVNPLPKIRALLGDDYPLYFYYHPQVRDLAQSDDKVLRAHAKLCELSQGASTSEPPLDGEPEGHRGQDLIRVPEPVAGVGAQADHFVWFGTRVRRGGSVVIVLSFGKVASSSVVESLRNHCLEQRHAGPHQMHVFTHAQLEQLTSNAAQLAPMNVSAKALHWAYCNHRLALQWKFIAGVRDPIALLLSRYYQNKDKIRAPLDDDYLVSNMANTEKWFDRNYREPIGLDVYSQPFDTEKGYGIFRNQDAQLLVYRFEDLPRIFTRAMHEYLDVKSLDLVRVNVAADKAYAEEYERTKAEYRFDPDFIEAVYTSRYARHFYRPEEIEALKRRWLRLDS